MVPESVYSEKDIWNGLVRRGAVWQRENKPSAPHVRLTSGKLADAYVNLSIAFEDTGFLLQIAEVLWARIKHYQEIRGVQRVVSSSYAAIPFGAIFAAQRSLRFNYLEKSTVGRRQLWKRGSRVKDSDLLLQVEDLMSTGSTIFRVRDGIAEAFPRITPKYVPLILCAVNHMGSNILDIGGKEVPIISATTTNIVNKYDPDDSPFGEESRCFEKPKEDWDILQTYGNAAKEI